MQPLGNIPHLLNNVSISWHYFRQDKLQVGFFIQIVKEICILKGLQMPWNEPQQFKFHWICLSMFSSLKSSAFNQFVILLNKDVNNQISLYAEQTILQTKGVWTMPRRGIWPCKAWPHWSQGHSASQKTPQLNYSWNLLWDVGGIWNLFYHGTHKTTQGGTRIWLEALEANWNARKLLLHLCSVCPYYDF